MLPITETDQENEAPEAVPAFGSEPKILSMRAYTVNGRPLYYGSPESEDAFCVPEKQWVTKPTYMDYFEEREIRPSDLGHMVIHGLVDDNDFSTLKDAGVVDPTLEQMYEKVKELTEKIKMLEELDKSDEEIPNVSDEEMSLETPTDAEIEETGAFAPDSSESAAQVSPAFMNLLAALKEGVSSSVLDQMMTTVHGLDVTEAAILKLVSEKFGKVA
jgi:hypothetical protein